MRYYERDPEPFDAMMRKLPVRFGVSAAVDPDWDQRGSYVELHSQRLARFCVAHRWTLPWISRYMRLRNRVLGW